MSQMHPQTSQYIGTKRKLVLAFDIGTTYSGISYSILDPGQVPEIRGVMRFPAHEQISGASKIPTVLYYDQQGNMMAAGAEALNEGIYEIATERNWDKAEWFKLRVRSERGTTLHLQEMLPSLPPNKTVIQILADFMQYLHACARNYIQDTHANGRDLWASVENEIVYVISHPNGWEGYQQSQMHDAAILAGLIPFSEQGKGRITFVTEGEASLHYAIRNGLPSGALNNGEGVIIVDAGGGTVDLSAYRKLTVDGTQSFEEIAVPQCHFFGSAFVSIHARIFLSQLLADSTFFDDLDHIVQRFDSTTKLRFRSDLDPQFIRFGGNRDNDGACGIRYGQLKLTGLDVANFFAPSIKCIVDTVLTQVKNAHNPISHVVLVGGFSSSDWLFDQVVKLLQAKEEDLRVIRPENYVSKAVSDGAISFYLHRQVISRVSKFAYGTFCKVEYDEKNPDHRLRKGKIYIGRDGRNRISGGFRVLIANNQKVKEKREYRSATRYQVKKLETLKSVPVELWCYRGENVKPRWKDEDRGMYSLYQIIIMDLSHITHKRQKADQNGAYYYEIEYDYILFYEGVELKAQVAWRDNGAEKRGPAHVIYDPTD